jgi:hypothetical protein
MNVYKARVCSAVLSFVMLLAAPLARSLARSSSSAHWVHNAKINNGGASAVSWLLNCVLRHI